ncbi:unnamed protein product, partial [Prorocentrum cordatum]
VKLYVLRPKSPSAPPKGIIKNVSFAKDSKDSDAGSNQSTPRSSKASKGTRGQAVESSARTLLEQAIAAAQDPKLKEALMQQVVQLKREEAQHMQPKDALPSLQRADSAWRDANNRHTQSVQSVLRIRRQLEAAELKERRLAEELAEATIVKQQAARALATAEGVVPKPSEGKADDKCGKPFELVYDHTLFDNLDELECEDSEKETLRKIHSELQSAKTTLDGKADEVTTMLKNAQDMRQAIKDRFMKKRRTAEGQAAPPAAPQPGEAAPAASGGSGSGGSQVRLQQQMSMQSEFVL